MFKGESPLALRNVRLSAVKEGMMALHTSERLRKTHLEEGEIEM